MGKSIRIKSQQHEIGSSIRNGLDSRSALLVFNCHEAWVHQLSVLGLPFDVVVGLKGRAVVGWDHAMRPQPPNSRLVTLDEAKARDRSYSCLIAHNLTDILESRSLDVPKLLVLHSTLDGIAMEQHTGTPLRELRETVQKYLSLSGVHVVAVSTLKGKSWGLAHHIVPFSVDPAEYRPYRGDMAEGLRIANQISRKKKFLRWDLHEAAFRGLPLRVVGRNEDMPGVRPARDWEDLKEILSRHRFFVHTADPLLEDGYNMAMTEAMAAGVPIIANRHPTCPIEHGVSGFVSDDPLELRGYALRLLNDQELAIRVGQQARALATRLFPPKAFADEMSASIEKARQLRATRKGWQPKQSQNGTSSSNGITG